MHRSLNHSENRAQRQDPQLVEFCPNPGEVGEQVTDWEETDQGGFCCIDVKDDESNELNERLDH
jgi:hypothetical protein